MHPPDLTEKILAGHRLMLGFDGLGFNDDLKQIIGEIKAAGLILFKQNIETPEQVKALIDECQAYAASLNLPPLFIAVDQEGGTVARLKQGFTPFKGNPYIRDEADAKHFAAVTAEELKRTGFNMNFAPVLDWIPDGVDSIMKERAFKGDVQTVSRLGQTVIETFQDNGIMAVAKHFPGIGRTVRDSHFHLPVLDIDLKTLEQSDLIPFKGAMEKKVSGVMLSHISYPGLDNTWQASLSENIADRLLRKKLSYDGLVMTDDLDMKAIRTDMKTCIQRILAARIDLALICHKGPDIDTGWQEIRRLLQTDPKLKALGQKSVERILRFKNQYL